MLTFILFRRAEKTKDPLLGALMFITIPVDLMLLAFLVKTIF